MTKYHLVGSCNACGGENSVKVVAYEESKVCEAVTKCGDCGHPDYWVHGFFESSQDIVSKCRTGRIAEATPSLMTVVV